MLCFLFPASKELIIDDLITVLERVWPARSKWYLIGLYLGIDVGSLDAIKRDNRDQSEDCFTKVLSTWLRSTRTRTWKVIVEVLQSSVVGVQVVVLEECKGQLHILSLSPVDMFTIEIFCCCRFVAMTTLYTLSICYIILLFQTCVYHHMYCRTSNNNNNIFFTFNM